MGNIDIVFNSQTQNENVFQIASGYISQTTVLFEKEKVTAIISAKGSVDFYVDEKLVSTQSVDAVESGREVYEQVKIQIAQGKIIIGFVVCEWIDRYPHCDGEHDRWDTKIIGYNNVEFNI